MPQLHVAWLIMVSLGPLLIQRDGPDGPRVPLSKVHHSATLMWLVSGHPVNMLSCAVLKSCHA